MTEWKYFIARNVQFIAWENFTWPVLGLWIYSLALLVLFLAVCLFFGIRLTHKIKFLSVNEALVLNFAIGSAMLSFLMAFLAVCHLFYLKILVGVLAVVILSAVFFSKYRFSVFAEPFHLIFEGFREEKMLYALFILNSLPSLLPPYRWDEMSYHLPYAMQWIEQGGISVDPAMRYPLNSFNFHMLQSVGLMLHSVPLTHLLSWLAGSLSCLLILVFLRRWEVWRPLAYAAALGFYLSPLVQRYLNVACIDVPCMFYLAAAVFTAYLARFENPFQMPLYLASAMVCAMFVGMRGANLFFIPLFLLLAKPGVSWRGWFSFLFVFLGFGSFWYLRNILIAHDPLPPVFNLFFHRPDPFWTTEDFRAMQWDMTQGIPRDLKSTFLLPYRLLTSTENGPLRDWPFQGFMLIFPLSVFVRKKNAAGLLIAAWYAVLFWIIVSPLVRYAHFAVLAAVAAALVLDSGVEWLKQRNIFLKVKPVVLVFVVFILIGPNMNAFRYFKNNFNRPVPYNAVSYEKFYDYLGLPEMQTIQNLKKLGIEHAVVYTVGYTHLKYYYQAAGYRLVGDVVNRFRYHDFVEKLKNGDLFDFFKETGAQAAAIDKKQLSRLDLSEEDVLTAINKDPRFQFLLNDQESMIIKINYAK